MSPSKVERNLVRLLTDLPNTGKAGADDLGLLGIHEPQQLVGVCPFKMYERLCEKTGSRHDPEDRPQCSAEREALGASCRIDPRPRRFAY